MKLDIIRRIHGYDKDEWTVTTDEPKWRDFNGRAALYPNILRLLRVGAHYFGADNLDIDSYGEMRLDTFAPSVTVPSMPGARRITYSGVGIKYGLSPAPIWFRPDREYIRECLNDSRFSEYCGVATMSRAYGPGDPFMLRTTTALTSYDLQALEASELIQSVTRPLPGLRSYDGLVSITVTPSPDLEQETWDKLTKLLQTELLVKVLQ